MRQLTILKLGGSAITDKTQELRPDLVTIHRSADALAKSGSPLLILHGGGSFAHPIAKKAHLSTGYRRRSQLRGLAETELYLDQLSRIIQVALLQRHVDFAPFRPMSFIETSNGKISSSFLGPIEDALRLGMVPLSHGDIVFDTEVGFSILSADRLASFLAVRLGASRVLFGSDVDGIYTADPRGSREVSLIPEVTRQNHNSVRKSIGASRDATGGMLTKYEESIRIARAGCEAVIFNLRSEGRLEKLLHGNSEKVTSTRFRGWSNRDAHKVQRKRTARTG